MGIWRRWVVAFTLGELVGFGLIPVLLGTVAFTLTGGLEVAPRALLLYAVAVLGGFGEGAVLATFQVGVLRMRWPELDRGRWTRATAAAAALAWAVGMLAPTLDDLVGLSSGAQVAIWVPGSLFILFSIGGAQALVLRGAGLPGAPSPPTWVAVNAVGWLLGLPWTFLFPALLPDTAPAWAFGVAMFAGGVLMGATTGAVTGIPLRRP